MKIDRQEVRKIFELKYVWNLSDLGIQIQLVSVSHRVLNNFSVHAVKTLR
jgi:hypothetical protein